MKRLALVVGRLAIVVAWCCRGGSYEAAATWRTATVGSSGPPRGRGSFSSPLPAALAALSILLLLAVSTVRADSACIDGFAYRDFRISGVRDGQMVVILHSGAELAAPFSKIQSITLDNYPAFNQAETAMAAKNYNKAATAYTDALAKIADQKVLLVAQARSIAAFDNDARWTDALSSFLSVYRASPTAGTFALRPANLPANDSHLLADSAILITKQLADPAFRSPDAQKSLKTLLLSVYTKMGDARAAPLATELGTAAPQPATAAATPVPAGAPDRWSELFPTVSTADASLPLTTAQDDATFNSTYGDILRDVKKGSADDRASALQLLLTRADHNGTVGPKRLLLLAAYDLAKTSNIGAEATAAIAHRTLGALDENTIAARVRRTVILTEMYSLVGKTNPIFSAGAAADEMYRLAGLQYCAGKFDAAASTCAAALKWTARDPEYAGNVKPTVDRFTAELDQQIALEKKLAANPNDPDANGIRGMWMLAHSTNAVDAAPYLARSNQKELRTLADALTDASPTVAARLKVASAAIDAADVTTVIPRMHLLSLAWSQIQIVAHGNQASEAEKARAELLTIKMERLADKPGENPDDHRQDPVAFFGLEASSRRIVYVVDHSGSLLDNFNFLQKEVNRSITDLQPTQSFGLIVFAGQQEGTQILSAGPPPAQPASPFGPRPANLPKPVAPAPGPTPAGGMERATTDAKREAVRRLNMVVSNGRNDDELQPFLDAFQAAFKLQPDLIYFVTDGRFDHRLIDEVKNLNVARKVRINTIAFVGKDDGYFDQMRQISKDSGGSFKFVSEKDLAGIK